MFKFLKAVFRNNSDLKFDSPELKVGSIFINDVSKHNMKKGESPTVFHITDIDSKKKKVSFYTTYRDIKNPTETLRFETFKGLLKR